MKIAKNLRTNQADPKIVVLIKKVYLSFRTLYIINSLFLTNETSVFGDYVNLLSSNANRPGAKTWVPPTLFSSPKHLYKRVRSSIGL